MPGNDAPRGPALVATILGGVGRPIAGQPGRRVWGSLWRMRFPVATVRVFQSRASTGVRGIALAEGDEVISMSLFDSGKGIATEEREGYLRQSRALRQAENALGSAGENGEE